VDLRDFLEAVSEDFGDFSQGECGVALFTFDAVFPGVEVEPDLRKESPLKRWV